VRKDGSLKDEIESRMRARNFFSTKELVSLMEYSFEQLIKLA
jgi:hypothetical protein